MHVSKRLSAIASLVDKGSYIADIGSDHCVVPILLAEQKKIVYAEAVENKKGPYQKMCHEIQSHGLEDVIHPVFADGIEALGEKVDTVVLAGMGGRLIISILEKHPERLKNVSSLILDPHGDLPSVRSFLASKGFLECASMFFYDEGIAYNVMKWGKSSAPVTYCQQEIDFGPMNLKHPSEDWFLYWEKQLRYHEGIASKNLPLEKRKEHLESCQKIRDAIATAKQNIN